MNDESRKKIDDTKENILSWKEIPPVIALRDGRVLDGAHRVIAYRELEMEVPVVYLDKLVEFCDPNKLITWLDGRSK